eukprot:4296970-Pyramimonas_sp.AAC.1
MWVGYAEDGTWDGMVYFSIASASWSYRGSPLLLPPPGPFPAPAPVPAPAPAPSRVSSRVSAPSFTMK